MRESGNRQITGAGFYTSGMALPPHAAESVGGASDEITNPYTGGPEALNMHSTARYGSADPIVASAFEENDYTAIQPPKIYGGATVRERTPRDDVSITTFRQRPDGLLEPIETPVFVASGTDNIRRMAREKITETFQTDRDGMDIERVDNFIRAIGIQATARSLELPAEQRSAVVHMLRPFTGGPDKRAHSFYEPQTDIAFTFRDPRREELNGATITDTIRVHELTHSGGERRLRAIVGDTLRTEIARTGWWARNDSGRVLGNFVSEGLAEYTAGTYVAEELGMPTGHIGAPGEQFELPLEDGSTITLPSRYVSLDMQGKPEIALAAYAATALGHLIDRDPAIFPALIAGQENQAARDEAIARMNAVHPSMGMQLINNFDNGMSYAQGLRYVRGVLGIEE